MLGQEAVPDKAGELAAIPLLIERLAERGGLDGALVTIDTVATNPTVATAIRAAGADYLLAVKATQPTLRPEIETAFARRVPLPAIYPLTSARLLSHHDYPQPAVGSRP